MGNLEVAGAQVAPKGERRFEGVGAGRKVHNSRCRTLLRSRTRHFGRL